MECTTKDRILDTALDLFSSNGYNGTSMRDLANALGLSKSALYKHYDSKETIRNSLLEKIEAYYAKHIGYASSNIRIPESIEELRKMSLKQIDFTMHDEKIGKTRKLLSIEQFNDKKMADLTTKHFEEDIRELYKVIFEGMMTNGLIAKDDAEMLAFEYIATISVLIHQYDRQPWLETEIKQKICLFIDRFTTMLSRR